MTNMADSGWCNPEPELLLLERIPAECPRIFRAITAAVLLWCGSHSLASSFALEVVVDLKSEHAIKTFPQRVPRILDVGIKDSGVDVGQGPIVYGLSDAYLQLQSV